MRLNCFLGVLFVLIGGSRQRRIREGTLEDAELFGKFLEESVDGEPQSDADDEYIAWESSGKFEGDMVLSERQRKVLVEQVVEGISRNGLRDLSKRWPDNTVVYLIDTEDFGLEYVDQIMKGMEDIEANSCIKFRQKTANDQDYVKIQGSKRGCFSKIGYVGGEQPLNLQPRRPGVGCFRHGTIVHELLHTIGFLHMQSHSKRDDYVTINWDNIVDGNQQNFRKYSSDVITDFGVPYDYSSVLHYSDRAFSKNGRKTIVPRDTSASIGQRIGMTSSDIEKMNLMYNCGINSNDKPGPVSADEKKTRGRPASKMHHQSPSRIRNQVGIGADWGTGFQFIDRLLSFKTENDAASDPEQFEEVSRGRQIYDHPHQGESDSSNAYDEFDSIASDLEAYEESDGYGFKWLWD